MGLSNFWSFQKKKPKIIIGTKNPKKLQLNSQNKKRRKKFTIKWPISQPMAFKRLKKKTQILLWYSKSQYSQKQKTKNSFQYTVWERRAVQCTCSVSCLDVWVLSSWSSGGFRLLRHRDWPLVPLSLSKLWTLLLERTTYW